MDKKTLIALVLCAGILFSWPYIIKKVSPEIYERLYNKKNMISKKIDFSNNSETFLNSETSQKEQIQTITQVSEKSIEAEKNFILENSELKITFSNKGGVIKEVELLKYKNKQKTENEKLIQYQNSSLFAIEEPLNLKEAFFNVDKEQDKIKFTYKLNEELIIIKEYILKDVYNIEFNLSFQNIKDQAQSFIEGYKLNLTKGIGIFDKKEQNFCGIKVLINKEDKNAKEYTKNKNENIFNNAYWVAQYNRYFSLIVKPEFILNNIYIENIGDLQPQLSIRKKSFIIEKQEFITDKYNIYLGPKENKYLEKHAYEFKKIISYGFFNIIGIGIFWLLTFFYGLCKNYGIAIILLAIIIKVITHPLTQKSFNSMKEMQKINPLLIEIREKYKNDPARMQKETMLLYKKYKVNPLGGCLPVIIQMPIFFSLFSVLNNSIELRQTAFMLWITDLSDKDPYFVLPILMGISMFIQQKMSPATMDPKQAKIMLIMPVFLTFIFINLPSGLVLYWFANNVLTIAHQLIVKK